MPDCVLGWPTRLCCDAAQNANVEWELLGCVCSDPNNSSVRGVLEMEADGEIEEARVFDFDLERRYSEAEAPAGKDYGKRGCWVSVTREGGIWWMAQLSTTLRVTCHGPDPDRDC